jgi:NADH:ubiquinone oxidoreductase subunit B-like Fe-S oxidoreductase
VVLVSGPLSIEADEAIRRVLTLVPEPQALVAIGDCAINGCVFAGSTLISPSAAEALDVHVELPGCPPTPSSILSALARAAELLDESLEEDEVEEDSEEDEVEEDSEEDEIVDSDIDEEEEETIDETEAEPEPVGEYSAGEDNAEEVDTTRPEGEE